MVAIRKEVEQKVSLAEYQRLQTANQNLQRLLQEARNEKREIEQKYKRVLGIVYNTKWERQERIDMIALIDAEEHGRYHDEQGHTRINMLRVAERIGSTENTLKKTRDKLEQVGFIESVDKQIEENGDNRPRIYIKSDKETNIAFLDRPEPRKVKENRKTYTYRCQKCLKIGTVVNSRHLRCDNEDCEACKTLVLIDESYDEQLEARAEEAKESDHTEKFSVLLDTTDIRPKSFRYPEDESNKTHTHLSTPLDHDSVIKDWLEKRRGTDHIIYATGSLDPNGKYKYADKGYQPDLDAFIAGDKDHIYGSRLLNSETGLTSVLCFEIDNPEQDAQAENYLLDLARAGAVAVYWKRYANDRQRGHLEIYFDQAVNPEIARQWAIEICPDLEDVPECYPCKEPQDKQNQGLSWPLYQRIEDKVYPCQAIYMLPAPHAGGLQECDPTDKEALARLITLAVTPAALVEEYATVLAEREALQPREKKQENVCVCFIGQKPKPLTSVSYDQDLKEQVIADFNVQVSWDDIAAMAGGWNNGFFKAVWRAERTASVRPDRDGRYCCDYGNHGMFPKKLDRYGAYCLICDINQKTDLAERCAELRRLGGV